MEKDAYARTSESLRCIEDINTTLEITDFSKKIKIHIINMKELHGRMHTHTRILTRLHTLHWVWVWVWGVQLRTAGQPD